MDRVGSDPSQLFYTQTDLFGPGRFGCRLPDPVSSHTFLVSEGYILYNVRCVGLVNSICWVVLPFCPRSRVRGEDWKLLKLRMLYCLIILIYRCHYVALCILYASVNKDALWDFLIVCLTRYWFCRIWLKVLRTKAAILYTFYSRNGKLYVILEYFLFRIIHFLIVWYELWNTYHGCNSITNKFDLSKCKNNVVMAMV